MIFVKISSLANRVYGELVEPILHKCHLNKARYSSVFLLGLSFWIFLLITSALLTGCGSSKHIQTIPVETIRHDTLYINKQSYDSIYIDNSHLIDRGGDTVYIKDKSIEYRYRLLRDTIRIAKCDSIPYEVRITEVKEVPRRRYLFDYISYVCFGIILGLVVNKARAIVRTST